MAAIPATAAHPRRVTVVTPDTRVDLALPLQATVAEVVLQVVALVGAEASAPDGAAGGWLLGRLGAPALDPGRSVVSTDVRDGDVLYLTPRSARIPPALFDDVVDAIAEATGARPDRWDAASTRWTSVAAAVAVAVAGAAALAAAGPPWPPAVGAGLALALLLLAAAGVLSRAAGDAVAGAAAGFAALPFAAWAAARAVSGDAGPVPTGPAALTLAGGALALAAVLGALLVADLVPAFGAAAAAGAAAALGGGSALVLDASDRSVAAVLAVVAVMLLPAFPVLSVRLAGLPLPTIPVDMAEFRSDESPTPGDETLGLVRRGDAVLVGMLVAFALVVGACVAVLVRSGGTWPPALAAALSVVLALRAKHLRGRAQRLVLLLPGLTGLLAVAGAVLAGAGPSARLATAAAAGLLAVALLAYASSLPRRGATPYVGRLLDVVEFVALCSLLPLAGAVLGAYARIRGIGG